MFSLYAALLFWFVRPFRFVCSVEIEANYELNRKIRERKKKKNVASKSWNMKYEFGSNKRKNNIHTQCVRIKRLGRFLYHTNHVDNPAKDVLGTEKGI